MSTYEIEDVLSSIRRLVSEDLRPLPSRGSTGAEALAEALAITSPSADMLPTDPQPSDLAQTDATPSPTPSRDGATSAGPAAKAATVGFTSQRLAEAKPQAASDAGRSVDMARAPALGDPVVADGGGDKLLLTPALRVVRSESDALSASFDASLNAGAGDDANDAAGAKLAADPVADAAAPRPAPVDLPPLTLDAPLKAAQTATGPMQDLVSRFAATLPDEEWEPALGDADLWDESQFAPSEMPPFVHRSQPAAAENLSAQSIERAALAMGIADELTWQADEPTVEAAVGAPPEHAKFRPADVAPEDPDEAPFAEMFDEDDAPFDPAPGGAGQTAWADVAEAEVMANLARDTEARLMVDRLAQAQAADRALAEGDMTFDEEVLRDLVRDLIRQELAGSLGERITRNIRKLVRAEIARAMALRDFD